MSVSDVLVEASIDFADYDYIVNGEPLHEMLFDGQKAGGPTDFNVNGSTYFATSILCQSGTINRMLGAAEPDLIHGLTALYVCGHCGGYDGTLVGVHIDIREDNVVWSNIGYSSDIIETYPEHEPFQHVPNFSFKRSEYANFIQHARIYEFK